MNLKDIKDILKLLKGTDIVEFELERDDGKIRVRRQGYKPQEEAVAGSTPAKTATEVVEEKKGEEKKGDLVTITSPMVGTFYRSPSPDAPPFVEEGSLVKKGQPLCIIEAMKIMNEIEAEIDGKIISILVENGKAVEYGEPLFLVEPV